MTSRFQGSVLVANVPPEASLLGDLRALEDTAFRLDGSGSDDTATDFATLRFT